MAGENQSELKPVIDHLFRHEWGKLVAVLTRIFGPGYLELAEDVVQDTLIKAMESWKIRGIPENPSAWLFTAARNKALDVVRRERHHKKFAEEIFPLLNSEYTAGETIRQIVNENEITDEQLKMMFICCHPSVAEEAQVAMILKTLCGFSVAEIAKAFLTNEETITKRLYRGRMQFRQEKIAFALPAPEELSRRLESVLTAIYLIFNEGYNSTHHDTLIREDLVEESLRLGKMLVDHPVTCQPESYALLALLCFQAARVRSRVNAAGDFLPLRDQDRNLWDKELIQQGTIYLRHASKGESMSSYHIEAAIAYEHCAAGSYEATDWNRILQLYEWLYQFRPDPMIALNRLIVYGEVHGAQDALRESELLQGKDLLKGYYLYPATLGHWYAQLNERGKAKACFEEALRLTQSKIEKQLMENRIRMLESGKQDADAKQNDKK